MFSGEVWTLVVAIMLQPGVLVVAKRFSINIAVLLEPDNTDVNISYPQFMPAFNSGMDDITMWKNANYTFIHRNISCDGDGTAAIAAELHCQYKIGVFIGPACTRSLNALIPLAKSWSIPIITPVGSGISDPKKYPMVTKLSPYSVWSYVSAMVTMLTRYKWYNLAIIFDENSTESVTFKDGLILFFRRLPLFWQRTYPFNGMIHTSQKLRSLLVDASAECRVFIIACLNRESRALMLQAYHLGYATSGEYVFFIIGQLSDIPGPQYWQMGQPDDEDVLKALGHVIWPYIDAYGSYYPGLKWYLTDKSLSDYGYDYNGTELSPYLAGYSDVLWIYDDVINFIIYNGEDPLNGTTVTSYLWNNTFYGIIGGVHINEGGYRLSNVTFGYFNITSGRLETGALYNYVMKILQDDYDDNFSWPYSGGVPPRNVPRCGFRNNLCVVDEAAISITRIGTIAGVLAVVVLIGFIGAIFAYRGWKSRQDTDLWWWKIHSNDLVMNVSNEFSSTYLARSRHSLRHESALDNSLTGDVTEINVAVWKGQTVSLRRLPLKHLTITRTVLVEFKQIIRYLPKPHDSDDQTTHRKKTHLSPTVNDSCLFRTAQSAITLVLGSNELTINLRDVNHSNLTRIFGACFENSLKTLVTECCVKGSLQDLLGNTKITLDAQFKFSLCKDIINGLCYIHQSPIHQHGRLNSNVCLIDNRFSVKLTDFGLPTLYSNLLLDVASDEFKQECKWKAPEILRSGAMATGTMEGDIYSYGIILLEIITQDSPFAAETAYMTNDEILQKVQDGGDPPFRPAMELPVTLSNMKELIQSCWKENPKDRPSCQSVKSSIRQISASLGDTGNLLENLMRRMELYANNLEKMVEEKTAELSEEKKKSEELLYQILPRSVADRLKSGLHVNPQVYEGVSIYFSDIVGFTEISALCSPMEVVDLLNDIYSCFDAIIEEFDVYKVETIGDAYMVVSGLPQRNGNLHALNIARFSIKVLEAIQEFRIRHMPTEGVKIRIGLHSGPVCAGVVGSKMPRYCLFGDTVNTASRMESSGKPMMIHMSPFIKTLLDEFDSFNVVPRGNIAVKGKGQMFTYWLLASQNGPTDLDIRPL